MGWRNAIYAALVLVGQAWASDSSIPYRPDEPGLGMQAGLAYGGVVLVLALAVAGMLLLRKRLNARLPSPLVPGGGLRSISSLRLSQQTLVHVVAYRDREILFAQSGDKLLQLGEFARDADGTDRSA